METTARVAWSGAGINLKTRTLKATAVRAAVWKVLADPAYRLASSRIGAEIANSPGVAGIEAIITELMPATDEPIGARP